MIIRTEFQNVKINLEQMVSLHKVYIRYMQNIIQNSLSEKVLDFDVWVEKNVSYPSYDTCVMVEYAGMVLGIEQDGYTHS